MADSLMEDLAENECLELLSAHHFGRVAFVERAGAPPVIMPRRISLADLPSNWWG
jgi:nitroimidazol reductase NimA-like FMN-containing flavoprotein (pyridoxamine 5'-phosphate oxidase superfamily)